MSYFTETDSHIKDKVKIVLDLLNYAAKKELDHATGVDTFDLAATLDLYFHDHRLVVEIN